MGAPADVATATRGGLRGAGSQHAQADAEGERSLLGHPRQLPAADHPHDREPLGRGRPDPGSGAGLGTVRHGQNTIGSRSALSWARVGSGRVGAPMSTSTPEPRSGARRPGPARPRRRVGPDLQLRAPADPQLHPRAVDPARLHHLDGQQPQHARSTRHVLGRFWQVLGPDPQRDRLLLRLRRAAEDEQGDRQLRRPSWWLGVFTFTYTQRVVTGGTKAIANNRAHHPGHPLPPGRDAPGGDRPGGPAADRLAGDPVRSSCCSPGSRSPGTGWG